MKEQEIKESADRLKAYAQIIGEPVINLFRDEGNDEREIFAAIAIVFVGTGYSILKPDKNGHVKIKLMQLIIGVVEKVMQDLDIK